MRIAIFHELNNLSGAKKVAIEYGKILSKKHQVDLFYVNENEDKDNLTYFKNIYFFKYEQKIWKGKNWKVKIYKDFFELLNLYFLHKRIAKIIQKNKYDLILINPSKFTQAPFVLRFLNNAVYFAQEPLRIVYDDLFKIPKDLNIFKRSYEKFNRAMRKRIDFKNIKSAKLVLVNSKYSRKNVKKAYQLNAHVCYLGVDTNKFKNKNINKQFDLIFLGNKSNIEGFDFLKKTLSLYKNKPSTLFVFRNSLGKGITERELVASFNKSKISLCLSRREPFGLVPIEAMACGIPVIAVNEGGYKESVVNNKTGYLIDRDPEILKNKIDALLANKSLKDRMGRQARVHVEDKFTWEDSVSNFLKITKNIYE